MKNKTVYIISTLFVFLIISCSSPKYIYNTDSYNRQQELQEMRSEKVFGEILNFSSTIISAAFDSEYDLWIPGEQHLKKLNLINPTSDTIYVNMLSDVYWTDSVYCDFMDIRIPPKERLKILVPLDTNYNLYFSNTPQNDDDELMEINTDDVKQITLKPSVNLLSNTSN